ncbi:MAG: hypothetical protein VXW38_04260, partial [Bacteroidota bacterium]|nr:hypothetical protein [Bacteroidota bacterium]
MFANIPDWQRTIKNIQYMIDEHANYLVRKVSEATMGSSNEANLRHGIEMALEQVCSERHIGWTPFSLEKSLS